MIVQPIQKDREQWVSEEGPAPQRVTVSESMVVKIVNVEGDVHFIKLQPGQELVLAPDEWIAVDEEIPMQALMRDKDQLTIPLHGDALLFIHHFFPDPNETTVPMIADSTQAVLQLGHVINSAANLAMILPETPSTTEFSTNVLDDDLGKNIFDDDNQGLIDSANAAIGLYVKGMDNDFGDFFPKKQFLMSNPDVAATEIADYSSSAFSGSNFLQLFQNVSQVFYFSPITTVTTQLGSYFSNALLSLLNKDTSSVSILTAKTPSIAGISTSEDTQASGIVITRSNTSDDGTTHYKINNISGGTLYKNDGVTVISNNSFITKAEGDAGLKFTPTGNSDNTGTFVVQAANAAADTGLGGSAVTASVTVTAVADAPIVTTSTASGNEDTTISLNLDVALADTDGSESIESIYITGLPSGSSLRNSSNEIISPNIENNRWELPNTDALTGLKFIPPTDHATDFTMTITAISAESSNGSQATSVSTMVVDLTGVADKPTLTVANASGNEDATVALNLSVTEQDDDGSESLSLIISGVDNGTLNMGSNNGSGQWTLSQSDVTNIANLKYITTSDLAGVDTLTATAVATEDGSTNTSTVKTFTVTVSALADAPNLSASNVSGNEDSTIALSISTSQTDDDGSETLEIIINGVSTGSITGTGVSSLGGGSYSVAAANVGTLSYVPDLNATGTQTFTVTSTSSENSTTATSTSTFTVTLNAVQDTPTAAADTASIAEEGTTVSTNVLSNDTDPDTGDTLSVLKVGAVTNVATDITGSYGTLDWAADGTFVYSVNNANSAVQALAVGETLTDVFTYTLTDNNSATSTATYTVTINGANDTPTGSNDSASVTENSGTSTTTMNVLSNDTDVDTNNTLTVSKVGTVTSAATDITGSYGTLDWATNGSFIYALNNANATVTALDAGQTLTDAFTYTVSDGSGGTNTAVYTVTITGANDQVTLSSLPTVDTAIYGGSSSLAFRFNAADLDADGLTDDQPTQGGSVTTWEDLSGNNLDMISQAGTATYDTAGVDGSPSVYFDGNDKFIMADSTLINTAAYSAKTLASTFEIDVLNGSFDVIYEQGGVNAGMSIAIVSNHIYVSVWDISWTTDYHMLDLGLATVDTAYTVVLVYDGDAGTVKGYLNGVLINSSSSGVGATLSANSDDIAIGDRHQFSLNPETLASSSTIQRFQGRLASLTEWNRALSEDEITANVAINEASVTTLSSSVLNASDADDGASELTYTITNKSDGYLALSSDTTTSISSFTQAQINAGSIVFVHNGEDTSANFTYSLADGGESSTTAVTGTVKFVVNISNDAPITANDTGSVTEDGTSVVTTAVLTNDSDAEGDAITVSQIVHSAGGTISNQATDVTGSYGTLDWGTNGSLVYTVNNANASVNALDAGESLTDVFTYTAADANGGSTTATYTVTINGANDAPVGVADTGSVTEDGTTVVTTNVISNDTDVDVETLTATQVIHATGGTVSNEATDVTGTYGTLNWATSGSFVYTMNNSNTAVQALDSGESLTDVFTYTVSDGTATHTATYTVTINGANDTPVGVADTGSVTEDGTTVVTTNVISNDTDVDVETLTATQVVHATGGTISNQATDITGTYGTLNWATSGSFVYTMNNSNTAVQALDSGETLTDVFTYTVSDGTATHSATYTVTINGANDQVTLSSSPAARVDLGASTSNEVFRLVASDPDGDQNFSEHIDGASITQWWYARGEGASATATIHELSGGSPTLEAGATDLLDSLSFDGASSMIIADDANINTGTYASKSFAFTIKTGTDLTGFQVIYEQGGSNIGFNLSIDTSGGSPHLYAMAYSSAWSTQYHVIDLGVVTASTIYSIVMVYDGSGVTNSFSVYLNGALISTDTSGIGDTMGAHTDDIGIGGISQNTVRPTTLTGVSDGTGAYYKGEILSLASWNRALSSTEAAANLIIGNGGFALISNSILNAADVDDNASQLTYSVTSKSDGYLAYIYDTSTSITSFTQADVDAQKVVFVHTGGASDNDASFAFSLADGGENGTTAVTGTINMVVSTNITTTASADTLNGYAQDDYLSGGNGNDLLYGNDGDDVIVDLATGQFVESGGVVIGEAEDFYSRSSEVGGQGRSWKVVGVETTGTGTLANASFGYVQVLNDLNVGASYGWDTMATISYQITIATTGTYQLYVKWAGADGAADSMYARIAELGDGTGGSVADWYRLNHTATGDFTTGSGTSDGWDGNGASEVTDAGGGDVSMTWVISSAGTYTLQFGMREDGVGIDAFVLQLSTLAAPTSSTVTTLTDTFYGNAGDDVLDGGIGNDYLYGNEGDDVLMFDAEDATINGGSGTDTLRFDDETGIGLNLGTTTTVYTDIEKIDLQGSGNNTLTSLTADQVLNLSTTTDSLFVDGNAGDVVSTAASWTNAGTTTNNGVNYNVYTATATGSVTVTLYIDTDVTQTGF